MQKRKRTDLNSTLHRIEQKCNRIISEVLVIRHSSAGPDERDTQLKRIASAASSLEETAQKERNLLKSMIE